MRNIILGTQIHEKQDTGYRLQRDMGEHDTGYRMAWET